MYPGLHNTVYSFVIEISTRKRDESHSHDGWIFSDQISSPPTQKKLERHGSVNLLRDKQYVKSRKTIFEQLDKGKDLTGIFYQHSQNEVGRFPSRIFRRCSLVLLRDRS